MINNKSYKIRDEFIKENNLPSYYKDCVNNYFFELGIKVNYWVSKSNKTLCIGINGAQGTGKSTLAKFLSKFLYNMYDVKSVIISLDDLYKTKKDREKMSKEIHTLFKTRGVPGTHDVNIGYDFIKSCIDNSSEKKICPRFNKSIDDRCDENEWIAVNNKIDLIILEGWCVGAIAQDHSELEKPINVFEEENDPHKIWRIFSNNQLNDNYQDLFNLCSYLIMIKAPNFEIIKKWRLKQEIQLKKSIDNKNQDFSMDKNQIFNFVKYFERLTRWILKEMPHRADVIINLNNHHYVESMHYK